MFYVYVRTYVYKASDIIDIRDSEFYSVSIQISFFFFWNIDNWLRNGVLFIDQTHPSDSADFHRIFYNLFTF